jgi:predicted DCC family thiol-disulfide oxidoreductase YuxK
METATGQSGWHAAGMADRGIVLFDGHCAFCNRTVYFIWRRDRQAYFRFAPLQSESGARLLARHGLAGNLDTVVLIEGDRVSTRSTAALRIARHLGWPWRLLAGLLAIPSVLRDPIYTALARRRYRWFGRSEGCAVPPPDLKERCIDDAGGQRPE